MIEPAARAGGRARRWVAPMVVLAVALPLAASPPTLASTPSATGTPSAVLLHGDVPRPEGLVELMPVPAGARARYFPLDADAFEAAAVGRPTGDDAWRDPRSTCTSLAPRDLVLEVFDGRTVAVAGVRAERCTVAPSPVEGLDPAAMAPTSETTSWIGQATVDGSILVSASFTVVRSPGAPDVVIGSIDDAKGHHVVQPASADGLAVLYEAPDTVVREDGIEELNPSVRPDADVPVTDEPASGASPERPPADPSADEDRTAPDGPSTTEPPSFHPAVGRASDPPTNAGSLRTIRIAVVYGNGITATAALWHATAGTTGMNTSLLNSDVPAKVEIAGSPYHANYTQTSSMLTDIERFQGSNDSYLNEIHLLRPGWEADLGMLILPGPAPGTCGGLGYVPTTVEGEDLAAFSLQLLYGCNNTVMAHEVGHNLGSYHDPANSHAPGDPLPDIPFSFSYGHYVSTKGRDNMAYATFCTAPCPTKPQYADPDIDLIGFPGVPSGTLNRQAAASFRLTSWGVSELYPRTSNDHIWTNQTNRTHGSINVASNDGNDREAPFTPIGGRFTGSGGSIMWYFPDNGPDELRVYGTSPTSPASFRKRLLDTYRPVSGDFNGDGRDDIFWHGPGTSTDWLWWGQANGATFGTPGTTSSIAVSGSYQPTAGDFDGDGRDDILWYSPTGQDSIWWGQSSLGGASSPVSAGSNLVPITGDFDGDGRDDILWYGDGATPDSIWWGQAIRSNLGGPGTTSSRTITGSYLPAAGDFDGDGRSDIIFYGPGTGSDYFWWGHASRATFGPNNQTVTAVSGQYATPIPTNTNNDATTDLYWFAYG